MEQKKERQRRRKEGREGEKEDGRREERRQKDRKKETASRYGVPKENSTNTQFPLFSLKRQTSDK